MIYDKGHFFQSDYYDFILDIVYNAAQYKLNKYHDHDIPQIYMSNQTLLWNLFFFSEDTLQNNGTAAGCLKKIAYRSINIEK